MLAAEPLPVDDLLLVSEDEALTFDYLLLNDSDVGTIVSTTSPVVGSLSTSGGESFTYTPAGVGDDSFAYTVSDGQDSASATVEVSVNEVFDVTAARDAILAGVTHLANPGSPGHMVVWGPTAQVIASYRGQDESDPAVAAATMGAGRIIALPDHQWLNMDNYQSDASTGNLFRNGLTWLTEGSTDKAIKIVTLNSDSSDWLASDGFTNVVNSSHGKLAADLNRGGPDEADVLVTWPGSNPSQAVIDEIVAFTKAGGGLFICDYGVGYDWWWGKEGPDIPGNLILRDAGIGFVPVRSHSSGEQRLSRASHQITVDEVIRQIAAPADYSQAEKDRTARVYDALNRVLADNDTLQARLDTVFATQLASLIPTPATPVSDSLEKALLNQEGLILQGQPVTEMSAHRAALPVDEAAPRIHSHFTLAPPAQGHLSRLIDTGLYAAPGEIVEVVVPAPLVGIGLQVRIGHLRTDTDDTNYLTMPYQQLTFEIGQTEIQVGSPHGGLIMFNAPAGTQWTGDQNIEVNGAVQAPYFVLGQTTNDDWVNGIRDRGTPFGVLASESTVLVIESEQWLRTLADPHEVMTIYNNIIPGIVEFYDYEPGRELRIHHDYQPAGGVSAFPLSYKVEMNITDSYLLTITGEPLTMHEHGHHADSNQIIFHQFGETSPNLGGKYVQQTYSNFSWKQETGVGRVNNYLFTQTDQLWDHGNHYKVDVKGTPFDSIAEIFGWESLKNVVHAITGLPSNETNTDQNRLDQWLIQIGNETGRDVSPFLELWQLTFSASAKAAVDELPAWNMVQIVGEDLVLEQNGSITFGDPTLNDFSYDGTLALSKFTTPDHGSLIDNENGTWTYTPHAEFIGKDAIDYTVTNGTGNSFAGTIAITVTTPANFPAIEQGRIYAGTGEWSAVNRDRHFTSPVVIAQVVQTDGLPPLITRLRQVGNNSFELKLQRVDGQTDTVANVQVQYMVVEEGVYNVADHGIKMEAVTLNSTVTDAAGNFTGQNISLGHDLWDHYFIPVMMGQVMSYNDPNWSVFWSDYQNNHAAGSAGYTVGKHVGEDSNTTRANETLGYVILESGSLQIGDLRFQAGSLNHDAYSGFKELTSAGGGHTFVRMPPLSGAIVQAQGLDDTENGYWTSLTDPLSAENHVSARLVEDQLNDDEQSHGSLDGSYVLFTLIIGGDLNGSGSLEAGDIDLLLAHVAAGDTYRAGYDLVPDGVIDQLDADDLIVSRMGTQYGDTNLDGVVDGRDFSQWNEHRFQSGTGWATADFNGDGLSDVRDFNIWNQNKFIVASLTDDEATSSNLRVPRAAGPGSSLVQSNVDPGQLAVDASFAEPVTLSVEPLEVKVLAMERSSSRRIALRPRTVDQAFALIDARDRLGRHEEPEAGDIDSDDLQAWADSGEEI